MRACVPCVQLRFAGACVVVVSGHSTSASAERVRLLLRPRDSGSNNVRARDPNGAQESDANSPCHLLLIKIVTAGAQVGLTDKGVGRWRSKRQR